MKSIGFVGLGLIGGSIAKAIKKAHPDYHLIAFDQDRESLGQALSEGILDSVVSDVKDASFLSCDYLFLCAPVEFNLLYLDILGKRVHANCVITDVGSVKENIHKKAGELGLLDHFIGGHPMAGSEKTGFASSSAQILENAYYMITPGEDLPINRLSDFTELVRSMGAIPMVVTCQEHDFMTAGVSHLPHLIASSLVNLVKDLDNDEGYMKTIAAGGFRDITRIASSSPVMWQQICLENQANISFMLDEYIRSLIRVRTYVDNRDSDSIYNMFASSRDYRDSIDVTDNGLLKKLYMLYIEIADEAGGIATVATILALDKINIKNIGIIHNREFEQGVLKIEFYEEAAMQHARELLIRRNYIIHERT